MADIRLNINKGFNWYNYKNIFVKGCFFDAESNFYEKENLCSFFKDIESKKELIKKLSEINGMFTILIKQADFIFLAGDIAGMFPVFYSILNNKLILSDDIKTFQTTGFKQFDEQSINEFTNTAHTLEKKTILKNVYRLQSSEYIIFKNNKIEQQFYFSYSTKQTIKKPHLQLKQQAIKIFDEAFKRLIISLDNRQVILPLSGGYDSRLIAVMLKKYNYENVICFTFGRKNNAEVENSKKTAKLLDFKWLFIEYSEELIKGYVETDTFKEYIHFTGRYSSMPFLQEYFAIKYLRDNNIIENNSVFIPGHSGDFLAGSQLVKVINERVNIEDIPALIVKKKFFYNKKIGTTTIKAENRVKELLYSFNKDYKENIAYSVFEDYDLKEKISKFIFNSTGVFNFFGYEHRIPFWDKELLLFFKNVPFEQKKMKSLYDGILKNYFFKPYNLNFEKETQPTLQEILFQKIKNKIKSVLPFFIKEKFLKKNDWKNYELITKQMENSMNKNNIKFNSKVNSYNEIIIQWYLNFVKDLIK